MNIEISFIFLDFLLLAFLFAFVNVLTDTFLLINLVDIFDAVSVSLLGDS